MGQRDGGPLWGRGTCSLVSVCVWVSDELHGCLFLCVCGGAPVCPLESGLSSAPAGTGYVLSEFGLLGLDVRVFAFAPAGQSAFLFRES